MCVIKTKLKVQVISFSIMEPIHKKTKLFTDIHIIYMCLIVYYANNGTGMLIEKLMCTPISITLLLYVNV